MAYIKKGFVDGITPLDAEHFNHMEEGIAALDTGKQNKLTGAQGQIVGFDASGNAVAQAVPESGGGTVEVDATLSVTGKAADAKATGDAIAAERTARANAISAEEAARKAEIDVERKRINALSSLGGGSTTGDAELIDGRTDAEGVTHTNIGGAIRHIHKDVIGTQSGDLINREAVNEERTTFFEVSSNILPDVEVDTTNPGMILNTNTGELYAATGATTDYFRLKPNTAYYWRTDQTYANMRMCLYDSEKRFVKNVSAPTAQNVDVIINTPANVRYARMSHMGCTDYTKGIDIFRFYIGVEPYDGYSMITPGCKRFKYDITESIETEVINLMQYEPSYANCRSNQPVIGSSLGIEQIMATTSGYTASDYIPIPTNVETLYVGRRNHELNNGRISYPAFDQTYISLYDERKRCIVKNYKSTDGSVPVPKWARYFTFYIDTAYFPLVVIFADVKPGESAYESDSPITNTELAEKSFSLGGKEIALIPEAFPWQGKTWLSYGDSITAIGHGDNSWHNYVKKKLRLDGQYVRGVGGSTYTYNTGVVFANSDGSYHSRNDGASMLNPSSYTVPSGCTAHWGYMASWSRIKTQIPDSIKNDIDLIFLFGVNNGISAPITEIPKFISGAVKDAEWAAADENTLGGDFDVTSVHGAIASTLLKLQTRCPNALIVIGTGWSGESDTNPPQNTGDYGDYGNGVYYLGQTVKNVANYFSFNVLDLWGTTQVNPWNRTDYIEDGVHPYLDKGKKALARAVISGLSKLHPRFDTE